jgi:uncharacterized protein
MPDGSPWASFAFDLAPNRSYDQDGHMRVRDNTLSVAGVSPYWGHEVIEWEKLGLDPKKLYQLLRDPTELARGAETFEGKPILLVHRGSLATDHPRALSVGSIGQPVRFDGKKLRAPLSFWDQEAIDGIETNAKRQLSCGYRYDADMTPGVFEGKRYDGVMRNIRGNHLAMVPEGRAGPDAIVGDAALSSAEDIVFSSQRGTTMPKAAAAPAPNRTRLLASGAIRALLVPRLAKDAKIDLGPILKGVSGKTWKTDKPRVIAALKLATDGKLAKDADMDDLPAALGSIDAPAAAEALSPAAPVLPPSAGVPAASGVVDPDVDPAAEDDAEDDGIAAKVHALLANKLPPEDVAAVMAVLSHEVQEQGQDEPPANGVTPQNNNLRPPVLPITKQAMDIAIAKAVAETESKTVETMNAIADARNTVRPRVGELAGTFKKPAEVFKLALDQMGVGLTGIPEEAYGSLYATAAKLEADARAASRPSANGSPPMALDAAQAASFKDRYGDMPRFA